MITFKCYIHPMIGMPGLDRLDWQWIPSGIEKYVAYSI